MEDGPNPLGLCQCGCEQTTEIARYSDKTRGTIAGQPMRYVRGHWRKKHGPGLPPGVIALYDPQDQWLIDKYSWFLTGHGYLRATISKGKCEFFHRLVVQVPPGLEVDHINWNKLDNRRKNLRVVTRKEKRESS